MSTPRLSLFTSACSSNPHDNLEVVVGVKYLETLGNYHKVIFQE